MPRGPRVPRASFSVTLRDDPDFVGLLLRGEKGYRAMVTFFLLVLTAKALRNGGRFCSDLETVAAQAHCTPNDIRAAEKLITEVCCKNGRTPWLTWGHGDQVIIRSFEKWNPEFGGAREGAGRPKGTGKTPNRYSSGNQVQSSGFNVNPKLRHPVSVVPKGTTETTPPLGFGGGASALSPSEHDGPDPKTIAAGMRAEMARRAAPPSSHPGPAPKPNQPPSPVIADVERKREAFKAAVAWLSQPHPPTTNGVHHAPDRNGTTPGPAAQQPDRPDRVSIQAPTTAS